MNRYLPCLKYLSNWCWLCLLLLFVVGCDGPGVTSRGILRYDGRIRTYRMRMPPGNVRPEKMPLVLILHGGYSAQIMADMSQFDPIADREGFLAVYPNAFLGWWDVDVHIREIDDVGYISALIDRMHDLYDIDLDRVFVTGSSNGGFMAYKLAIELNDKITAVAAAMSSMPTTFPELYTSVKPMPIMHVQGDEDKNVLIGGGEYDLPFSLKTESMPVRKMIEFWIEANKANSVPKISDVPDRNPGDGTSIVREEHEAGPDGAPVIYYIVKGGGHAWPGTTWPDSIIPGSSRIITRILGKTSMDMNTSETMWEFFKAQGDEQK